MTASWAGSSKTVFLNGEDSGKIERQMLTLMADGRAHWLRRPVWDVYSGISAGISHFSDEFLSVSADDDGTFNGFAFQLIPIGVRLGRHTGGFFETGFGTNGFVKAGLSQGF